MYISIRFCITLLENLIDHKGNKNQSAESNFATINNYITLHYHVSSAKTERYT